MLLSISAKYTRNRVFFFVISFNSSSFASNCVFNASNSVTNERIRSSSACFASAAAEDAANIDNDDALFGDVIVAFGTGILLGTLDESSGLDLRGDDVIGRDGGDVIGVRP